MDDDDGDSLISGRVESAAWLSTVNEQYEKHH